MVNISINDKKIPIYDNDTSESFIDRVASSFNTLPYLISFIDFEEIKKDPSKKYKLSLLVDEIKKDDSISFNDFIKENNIQEKYKDVTIDTLIKLWISYNKLLPENEAYFIQPEAEFQELGKPLDISRFLSDTKKDFLRGIDDQVKRISKKSKEQTEIYKKIDDLEPLEYVDFRKEKSVLTITTDIEKESLSMESIFSKLSCNEETPFASFSNVYKINQNFSHNIPATWSISLPGVILLKIYNRLDDQKTLEFDEDNYSDCIITFPDNQNLVLNVNIDYSLRIDKDIIKERLVQSLSLIEDLSFIKEEEESIAGVVIFPKQNFDKYVMSDVIMNNNIVSNFMAVDESKQASKKKSGLYLHFFISGTDGTASIISKRAEKTDQEIRNIDRKLLPFGSDFIRLRINKVKNMKIAEIFIEIFSKILNIYYDSYKNTVKFYKIYIPDFETEEEEKEIQKSFTLREIAPDLFLPNYTRRCLNPPKIIEDEEVKEYKQVMTFPKTHEEGARYNYTCDTEPYVYIGLRVNNLENKNKYKYIPCCFKKDQMTKNASPYKEYFEGKVEKKGDQQNILVTNKLAPFDEFAVLPKNINDLFFTIDDNFIYLRKGVNDTKQSFLECVLEGALKDFDIYGKKRKLSKLQTEYENLINYKNLSIASQENPGESIEEIRRELGNKEQYMDPRKWIRLCEVVYNCKIFLFSREKEEKEGVFEIPNHRGLYLRYKNQSINTIFIYEHYGNESDSATYPHCELIVKWDKNYPQSDKNAIEYNFIGKIPKEIENFEEKILNQYYYSRIDRTVSNISKISLPKNIKFTHQFIDNYGKARALLVDNIVLLCSPIPPLNVDVLKEDLYDTNDTKKVFAFLNKNKMQITSKYVQEGFVKEINIDTDTVSFTIKTNFDENSVDIDVPLENRERYPRTNTLIKDYVYLKRLALILTEYFIFSYSSYIHSGEKDISLESIKEFVQNAVVIEEAKYNLPSEPIADLECIKQNGFFDEDNNFIVENQEVLKRLVYSLRLRISNDQQSVKDYHNRKEIYNFYNDIRYFSKRTNNIILENLGVFEKIDNNVYDRVQLDKEKYFMRNSRILSGKPSLIVKSKDKEEADLISSNWVENGKISEESIKEKLGVNMYLYSSNKDVKLRKFGKGSNVFSNVLAYKEDGEVKYNALAKL